MTYEALIADIAELQAHYARRREAAEAAARKPAPLAKARPAPRPAARRPAPPPVKPAPRRAAPPPAPSKKEWKAFLRGHETLAKSIAVSLMETRIRRQIEAGRAQVARGEVSAIDAARLDVISHRATALGVWE